MQPDHEVWQSRFSQQMTSETLVTMTAQLLHRSVERLLVLVRVVFEAGSVNFACDRLGMLGLIMPRSQDS